MDFFKENYDYFIDIDLIHGLDLDVYGRKIESNNKVSKFDISQLLFQLSQPTIENLENLLEDINSVLKKMEPFNIDLLFRQYHTLDVLTSYIQNGNTFVCQLGFQSFLWFIRIGSNAIYPFLEKFFSSIQMIRYMRSPFLNLYIIALLLKIISHHPNYASFLVTQTPLLSTILSILPNITNFGRAGALLTLVNVIFDTIPIADFSSPLPYPIFLPDDQFFYEKSNPILFTFVKTLLGYLIGAMDLAKDKNCSSYQIQLSYSRSIALLSTIISNCDPIIISDIFTNEIANKIFNFLSPDYDTPPILFLSSLRLFNAVLYQRGKELVSNENSLPLFQRATQAILQKLHIPDYPKLRCFFVLSNICCFPALATLVIEDNSIYSYAEHLSDFNIYIKENIYILIMNLITVFPKAKDLLFYNDIMNESFDLLKSYCGSLYPIVLINTFTNLLEGPDNKVIQRKLDMNDVLDNINFIIDDNPNEEIFLLASSFRNKFFS